MVSQKRNVLLSEKERDRLMDRVNFDKRTNSTNDVRVKHKLDAWIDNLNDVQLILENLPGETSSSAIEEINIYQLLNIVSDLLRIKKFRRITGDAGKSDSWQTAPSRTAEERDIARAAILTIFLEGIGRYLGADNPLLHVMGLLKFYVDPRLQGRLTDDEKRSVEKCLDAVKDVYEIDLKEIYGKPPN